MKQPVEIIGLEKVEAVLNGLPAEIQKYVLKQATGAEAEKVRKAAAGNLQSGNAPQEVVKTVKKWATRSRIGRVGYWIGPKRAKGGYYFEPKTDKKSGYKGKAFAAAAPLWYEVGTYTGTRIKPLHWMERAVNSTIDSVERGFRHTLKTKIDKFLDKYVTGKAGKIMGRASKSFMRGKR